MIREIHPQREVGLFKKMGVEFKLFIMHQFSPIIAFTITIYTVFGLNYLIILIETETLFYIS